MTSPFDDWLRQTDIICDLESEHPFSGEWIPIYDDRDQCFERYYSVLIPLSAKKVSSSMRSFSWGFEFDQSKALMHAHHSFHFLSRSLRNRTQLNGGYRCYRDASGKEAARLCTFSHGIGKRRNIQVRRDIIRSFLDSTRQVLIRLVRCDRYSERTLQEYRKKAIRDQVHKGSGFHYVYEQDSLNQPEFMGRDRFHTFTSILGKQEIPL